MAASTVNIADFRCRGNRRSTQVLSRFENRSDLKVVDSEPAVEERAEVAVEGNEAENPSVCDISRGRESEQMRQRMVFRPISMPRHRSNEIRFNEPHVAVMRVEQPRSVEHWAHASDDCDLPPAA
jgi:hypothetical protein